jgi:putative heme iron utilization protein
MAPKWQRKTGLPYLVHVYTGLRPGNATGQNAPGENRPGLDGGTSARLTSRMSDPRPSRNPAILARSLARRCTRAALATNFGGAPYASLVLFAVDLDASPLLLLSDLARHSRNIAFDPRVSLLLDATEVHPDPLTGPRLTLLGRALPTDDPRALARFIAHHPTSVGYAGFADFHLYRVEVDRGQLIAGFGRIDWIGGGDLLFASDARVLAAAEPDILKHMNEDHGDAIEDYARGLLGRKGTGWRMSGIDPEGIDIQCDNETARLDFAVSVVVPVLTPEEARAALVQLAARARQ